MAEDIKSDEGAVVFVIDDDKSVRDSLEDLLASVGLRSMAFSSPQEFRAANPPNGPACIVLDVRMPGLGGLDFQQELNRDGIHTPIIFITAHGDIPMSVRAMKAGAIEFLTKPFRDQDLLDAINHGIAKDRVQRRQMDVRAELHRRYASLSEGERSVMDLVVLGLLNKQIAARLLFSEITVKVRRGQVMRKMQAASLADLVKMSAQLLDGQ